jgi:hypothetical protein
MASTLMQLRRLVRSRLGIPITDDFMTDRVLDDAINLAVQTIDAEQRWPWNELGEIVTINTTTPDIPLPDGWRATRAVFFDEHELIYVAPADLMSWLDAASDIPQVWSPMATAIAVRPTPTVDTRLRHLYAAQSTWLREDDDVPLIPEQYGGAIVAKAAELLSARESSGADAARHGAEYTQWVARMRRGTRTSTGPTRTRVRPGGWI